jgi:hypothetical protein
MIRRRFAPAIPAMLLVLLAPALTAQATGPRGPEPSTARVAVLPASLYNDQANVREATDTAQAVLATAVIRERLAEQLGEQAVAYGLIDSLAAAPEAIKIAGGVSCNVKVACAVAVAKRAGARWVVMTKVSKTSNLIWLLSGQLIRVASGDIILDDSTELKGEPGPMVRVGLRSFADRVVRTVRAGGFATNFPDGEPGS